MHALYSGATLSLRSPFIEDMERRVLLNGAPPEPDPNDSVLRWNAVLNQAIANDYTPSIVAKPDQGGPSGSARAMAIVHAAIYDVVNSFDRSYAPYLIQVTPKKGANMDAGVARAAHDTLVSLFPHQQASFDSALAAALR